MRLKHYREVFPRSPWAKTLPLSLGKKWFQILAFVFMENGEKFEGKPQNPSLLLKPQKLIKFKKKKQFLLRAELSSLKGSTFLFLKYLLRAP